MKQSFKLKSKKKNILKKEIKQTHGNIVKHFFFFKEKKKKRNEIESKK
jgi:hypothetical protein